MYEAQMTLPVDELGVPLMSSSTSPKLLTSFRTVQMIVLPL